MDVEALHERHELSLLGRYDGPLVVSWEIGRDH